MRDLIFRELKIDFLVEKKSRCENPEGKIYDLLKIKKIKALKNFFGRKNCWKCFEKLAKLYKILCWIIIIIIFPEI